MYNHLGFIIQSNKQKLPYQVFFMFKIVQKSQFEMLLNYNAGLEFKVFDRHFMNTQNSLHKLKDSTSW